MPDWADLPVKAKEKIVHHSIENTRCSLRACSHDSKMFVENVSMNNIDMVKISDQFSEWIIEVHRREMLCPRATREDHIFKNFNKFQTTLFCILESTPCLKRLEIVHVENERPFRLIKEGSAEKLRVEKLSIRSESKEQFAAFLSQLEPVYLRRIKLANDGENKDIYDMDQMIFAEKIVIDEPSAISEQQLMKLNARFLILELNCSLRGYFEKCVQEAGSRLPQFTFHCENGYHELKLACAPSPSGIAIIKAADPRLKLELQFSDQSSHRHTVTGTVQFDSERTASILSLRTPSSLRKIQHLFINVYEEKSNYWIRVSRKYQSPYFYNFKSVRELQKRLDEVLENVDFINCMDIVLNETAKELRWRKRARKLVVCNLEISARRSETSLRTLFDIIDPTYMDQLIVDARVDAYAVYENPHVYNCYCVNACGSYLNDSSLLRIKAPIFFSTDIRQSYNHELTASALNSFLKDRLRTLDTSAHYVEIETLHPDIDANEIIENMPIIFRETTESDKYRAIINSPFRDFVMEVAFHNSGGLTIRRRQRSEIERQRGGRYRFDGWPLQ